MTACIIFFMAKQNNDSIKKIKLLIRHTKADIKNWSGDHNFGPLFFVLAILAVIAIIFFLTGVTSHNPTASSSEIENTLQRLTALENKTATSFREYNYSLSEDVDVAKTQKEILSHYNDLSYNEENFSTWFDGAAIVGDSIAAAAGEYGYASESYLKASIGIAVYSADDVIAETISIQPSVVFLTFSGNDIVNYLSDVDSYIRDYREIIEELQENISGVYIFLQAVLPCQEEMLETTLSSYKYRDDYNTALKELADEMGLDFFDSSFILDAYPELFDADGLHPKSAFYPLWLTYMAEISGLTGE